MTHTAIATGKIILCGEYAVAFGMPGIAFPSTVDLRITYQPGSDGLSIAWNDEPGAAWDAYAQRIVQLLEEETGQAFRGKIAVENHLPLGKGMGSSTALVIAMTKALHSAAESCHPELVEGGFPLRELAWKVEDAVNPGQSGIDFAVIWSGTPLLFQQGTEPKEVALPPELKNMVLIDTGAPGETTMELVANMRDREEELHEPLSVIGSCAERILSGDDLFTVIRDHHRAQVKLGVVTTEAQSLITKIEQEGGAAKVIGAGGRTGGSGTVMALYEDLRIIQKIAEEFDMPVL